MVDFLTLPRRVDFARLPIQRLKDPNHITVLEANLLSEFMGRPDRKVSPPSFSVRHGLHSTNALSLRAVQPQVFTDLEIRRDVAHCRPLINNRSL